MKNGARERILTSIRRSLNSEPRGERVEEALRRRLASPPRGIIPARSAGDRETRLALFEKMAREVSATVERLTDMEEVPGAMTRYLKEHNLSPKLKLAPDPILEEPDWAAEPLLETQIGRAEPEDEVSVTVAFAGIAETGTLMLLSGPGGPTTLNFLPENNVVILKASRMEAAYENAWDRLREIGQMGTLPRTVNFITGPSRTADIEQTIQLGAHGPRRLHVLLICGPDGDAA